jgi:processive 1,2-diacylglycerol beta-glucosyltransferase
MERKKILIVSYSAGAGHVRAAGGLAKFLERFPQEYKVKHVDLNDHLPVIMRMLHIDLYRFMVQRIPQIYGFLYKLLDTPRRTRLFMSGFRVIKKISASRFFAYLKKSNPDLMICTHYLSAEMCRLASAACRPRIPIFLIVTDYCFHNFWGVEHLHHYFVLVEKQKSILEEQFGLSGKVTVSGVPIDPVFYSPKNGKDLRRVFNIDGSEKVILILSGGEGYTRIDRTVTSLFSIEEKFSIYAMAGKNRKLLRRLESLTPPPNIRLVSLGWIDDVDEYMRIADIIITKCGGLTITECLFLQRRIILFQPIGGQETANARFISETGKGHIIRNIRELIPFIRVKLSSPCGYRKEYSHRQPAASEIIRREINRVLELD